MQLVSYFMYAIKRNDIAVTSSTVINWLFFFHRRAIFIRKFIIYNLLVFAKITFEGNISCSSNLFFFTDVWAGFDYIQLFSWLYRSEVIGCQLNYFYVHVCMCVCVYIECICFFYHLNIYFQDIHIAFMSQLLNRLNGIN